MSSFITLGDWGGFALGSFHETTVTKVAKQMAATVTAAGGIDFLVNTGDNFYYCGIQNTSDYQIAEDFTKPYGTYSSLNVPWYGVLGNHEYGYDVDAQIALSQESLAPKWVMDDRYFTRRVSLGGGAAHATLLMLDTSPCVSAYRSSDASGWDPCGSDFPTCAPIVEGECKFHANILTQDCSEQLGWLKNALAAVPKDDWLIVVAHHPADEIDVEDFLTPLLSRGFDLYLNGHVHTLNQYTIDGGGSYVTSGAGAMVATQDQTTPAAEAKLRGGAWRAGAAADGHTYETVWNQKVAGFTLHTFSDDYQSLETQYIDYTGAVVHSFTTKKGGAPSPGPGPSPSPTPSSCGGAHAYPCTSGCTYVHKANAPQCGVAEYGCYDCSSLPSGCPDCGGAVEASA